LKDQTRKEWLLKLYTKFLEEPGVTLGFQRMYSTSSLDSQALSQILSHSCGEETNRAARQNL